MSERQHDDGLDILLEAHTRPPITWQPPVPFDLSDRSDRRELKSLLALGQITSVIDRIDHIAADLYELQNPDKMDDVQGRQAFVESIKAQGAEYGTWFYFPWADEVERFPDKDEHRALHTSRDRNLITAEEHRDTLYQATVVVQGLSVGSNVLENLATAGVGGKLVTGDPDIITPSNLNRIRSPFSSVGNGKVDDGATKVSRIDPYIEQVHFREGATRENLQDLLDLRPDLIFDEIDNLPMKAVLRQFAREHGIPLVMATDVGKTALVDVERYDLPGTEPFHGRLDDDEFSRLARGDITPQERVALMFKIIGREHIDERTMASFMQVGQTLPGLPQLGTTAAKGGAKAVELARDIIIGQPVPSGRTVI